MQQRDVFQWYFLLQQLSDFKLQRPGRVHLRQWLVFGFLDFHDYAQPTLRRLQLSTQGQVFLIQRYLLLVTTDIIFLTMVRIYMDWLVIKETALGCLKWTTPSSMTVRPNCSRSVANLKWIALN